MFFELHKLASPMMSIWQLWKRAIWCIFLTKHLIRFQDTSLLPSMSSSCYFTFFSQSASIPGAQFINSLLTLWSWTWHAVFVDRCLIVDATKGVYKNTNMQTVFRSNDCLKTLALGILFTSRIAIWPFVYYSRPIEFVERGSHWQKPVIGY